MVHTEHIKFGLPQAADLNMFLFRKKSLLLDLLEGNFFYGKTKPRRGEKFSGRECLGRGIFPRQFGRGGFGRENLKIFPAGGVWRGF